ncbi:hypothetical protein P7K49_023896 [Saguinus oedipus]|uniref:Uncharacterized protein n=1 Tax=Saguinus oedipus TaxID=9490 RepID=A0ABQ9UNU2_SAGOE|nr:hypothetical protein P7K49_023896 [Saguinus oedipus]
MASSALTLGQVRTESVRKLLQKEVSMDVVKKEGHLLLQGWLRLPPQPAPGAPFPQLGWLGHAAWAAPRAGACSLLTAPWLCGALCTERLYPLSWQAELRPRLACRERRRPGRARYVA